MNVFIFIARTMYFLSKNGENDVTA